MLSAINTIAFIIGLIGGVIIVVGVIHSFVMLLGYWIKHHIHEQERSQLDLVRMDLGRYVILGLEFFIAKDIIETLIVPTWGEIGMLAVVIVLRTVLSFFLTKELHQIEINKIEHRKIDAGLR